MHCVSFAFVCGCPQCFSYGISRNRKGKDRSQQDLLEMEETYKRLEEEKKFIPTVVKRKVLGDGGAREEETERKIKTARALLNKLSLEKFDKLSDDFIHVGFHSLDLLTRKSHGMLL